jgi:hypothetical protein
MRPLLKVGWALLGSILGLLIAPFFKSRRVVEGAMVCEGAAWPRKLGFRHRAITLGQVVLCIDDLDEKTLAHELVHVAQWERWGIAFLPAYLVASLRARLRGGHYYRDNAFEVQARQISGHP